MAQFQSSSNIEACFNPAFSLTLAGTDRVISVFVSPAGGVACDLGVGGLAGTAQEDEVGAEVAGFTSEPADLLPLTELVDWTTGLLVLAVGAVVAVLG